MQIALEHEGEPANRYAARRGPQHPAALRFGSRTREEEENLLIHRAKRGDRDAFDRLRESHAEALKAMLARKVRESEIEDLAQETWLSAWCALKRFDGVCRFRTWLTAIALHKLASHYRQGRLRESMFDAGRPITACYDDTGFDRSVLRVVLSQTLASLSGPQREVLALYYVHDLKLREIAGSLGRNLNTVKYQFYRGHAEAANRLGESFGEAGNHRTAQIAPPGGAQ